MTLLQALTVIFKHKGKILAIFFTMVATVTSCTLLQKPVYEAKASMLVKLAKDDSSRPGMAADSSLSLNLSQDELINTEIQILTGSELAQKVINAIRLANVYPDLDVQPNKRLAWEQAVQRFGKALKVIGVRKSNVITVSFQHQNPEIAARVVNLLVEAFKDKHLSLHSDPQSSFISSQLASFEAKLKQSENNLQSYQQKYNAFSLDEQRSLLLRQRSDFDSAYKIAIDNVKEIEKKIASLKSQMKYIAANNSRYTQTDRDKIIVDAKARLLELQLKEQELRRKYTDSNRLVVDARREVEMVHQFLREQEEGIVGKVKTANPVYQNMEMDLFRAEADYNSQMAKAEALKAQLGQIEKDVAALDASETTIQNLKRDVAINEKNYKTYADRHEEARIADAMNRHRLSNISVIESATPPVKPIKPKKKLNILLSMLLGMGFGLGSAFLLENIRQTFSDPESVEKYLELPVLLTVSSKEG
ncbi:hypothetical protein GMSM_23560 [Geomonas sp. Red276]